MSSTSVSSTFLWSASKHMHSSGRLKTACQLPLKKKTVPCNSTSLKDGQMSSVIQWQYLTRTLLSSATALSPLPTACTVFEEQTIKHTASVFVGRTQLKVHAVCVEGCSPSQAPKHWQEPRNHAVMHSSSAVLRLALPSPPWKSREQDAAFAVRLSSVL